MGQEGHEEIFGFTDEGADGQEDEEVIAEAFGEQGAEEEQEPDADQEDEEAAWERALAGQDLVEEAGARIDDENAVKNKQDDSLFPSELPARHGSFIQSLLGEGLLRSAGLKRAPVSETVMGDGK